MLDEPRSQLLPEGVAGESPDPDVLADRRDPVRDELADGSLLVAERLVEQAHLGEPLLELAFDDLRPDRLGLLLDRLVGEQLLPLGLEVRRRDRILVDIDGRQAGDLDREIADELLELVGAGDEVRLAVDLDQDADATAGMDVAADEALAGLPALLLRRGCQATVAEQG